MEILKKRWIIIGALAGILGALLGVFLPLSRALGVRMENRQLVLKLESRVEEMTPAQLERERSLGKWYNWNLTRQGSGSWKESYDTILNLEQGALGVLELPSRQLPICHGSKPMPGRAGHDPTSMLPLGNAGGHTVLFLAEDPALAAGMEVRVRCLDETFSFRVVSVQRMKGQWSTELLCPGPDAWVTLAVDQRGVRTLIRCREIRQQRQD